ncbi:DUF6388 family protein [Pseudomonas sp. ZL2]
MSLRDQIHENALAVTLEANPQLLGECDDMTEDSLCGMSLEQYRYLRLVQALEKEARKHRMDAWAYQLILAEDAGMDVSAIREEDRRAIAATLGVDDLL